MPKQTVQDLILDKLNRLEDKMDLLIPVVEGLKVKAAVAGGVAGVIGTAVVTFVFSLWK